jgi:hypothetical protein
MSNIISGNFTADGSSEIAKGVKAARIDIGTDTNENFGGGTLNIKVRASETSDWTTHESITESVSKIIEDTIGSAQLKVELEGATDPNLDYTIVWR